MSFPFMAPERERFRSVIAQRIGLSFDDAKLGFLDAVFRRRLDALKQDSGHYLSRLEDDPPPHELAMLAEELTVNETYLFRNIEQFRALAQTVLPERMRARAASKVLRLLSAGCASGEEAYSLAMVADDTVADPSWNVSVRAVDINPAVLEKARRAHFSSWALRETPADIQDQWFRTSGGGKTLRGPTRTTVSFEQKNLATDDPDLWRLASYDVIFCRNVLMYFTPEHASALIARIADALSAGGFLFLGHAETLRGLSDAFHLRHTHGTFYYERKLAVSSAFQPPSNETFTTAAPALDRAPDPVPETWTDIVREASERVTALVPVGQKPGPARAKPWDLTQVLELLRTESFAAGLAVMRDLPPELADEPEILLVEAMLLAHSGELTAAEAICNRLLRVEELNAGAHYVLALCREGAGDPGGAAEHDRVAVYLDPGFAMPRLHLGLLARRTGDPASARRELWQSLILLRQEDAARLLLFGGGFSREALIALCRSALHDCGGQA